MLTDIPFDYCSSFYLNPDFKGYQLIYSSQVMGTSFDVYASFNFVEGSYKKDAKSYQVKSVDLKIFNFKGILNFGFLSAQFKKSIHFENKMNMTKTELINPNEEYQTLSLDIGIKGSTEGTVEYKTEVIFTKPITITNKMGMIVNRKLFPLSGSMNNTPVVNGVFDDEFYYRDGTLYKERENFGVTDDMDDIHILDPKHGNLANSPGGWCKSGNIKFIIA